MYRTALRSAVTRPAGTRMWSTVLRPTPRLFASTTASASKPRSWKSSALRWGLAVAAQAIPSPTSYADNDMPTVDSFIEKKRKDNSTKPTESTVKMAEKAEAPAQTTVSLEGSPEALEEEAGQEGAFNPETGEINWDCPCLGGMAHGPCGEEFKTAFSCFVYSEEDPKGMDCIDKFQGMQECFRKYPEIYGAELEDADADTDAVADANANEADVSQNNIPTTAKEAPPKQVTEATEESEFQQLRDDHHIVPKARNSSETDNLPGVKPVDGTIPQKWDDATEANEKSKEDGSQKKPKEE